MSTPSVASSTAGRSRAVLGIFRDHPMTSFFVLACVFGWSPYVVGWLTGTEAENIPLGPVLAAAVVTLGAGGTMWRRWIHTVRSCGMPWRWFAVALLAPAAMHALQVLINGAFGAPLPTGEQLSTWPQVPVTFVTMLLMVGLGEEAGWTAFATPLLLTRHPFLVVGALMSAMRIAWHLPLMLGGDMPWVLGILGNAGFQMTLLGVYVLSGYRWGTAAVWHASLNALGGPFLFQMVEGADRDRLSWIMSVAYALLGLLIAAVVLRRVGREPRAPAEASPVDRVVPAAG
jgi:hypothetical protein